MNLHFHAKISDVVREITTDGLVAWLDEGSSLRARLAETRSFVNIHQLLPPSRTKTHEPHLSVDSSPPFLPISR